MLLFNINHSDNFEEFTAFVALGQLVGFQPFESSSENKSERQAMRPDKRCESEGGCKRIERLYFLSSHVYLENDFESQFRKPRLVLDWILSVVEKKGRATDKS